MTSLGQMSNLELIGLAVVISFFAIMTIIITYLCVMIYKKMPKYKKKIKESRFANEPGYEWIDWSKINL